MCTYMPNHSNCLGGVRAIGIAAALGGSLAIMYHLGENVWVNKGSSVISAPGWA